MLFTRKDGGRSESSAAPRLCVNPTLPTELHEYTLTVRIGDFGLRTRDSELDVPAQYPESGVPSPKSHPPRHPSSVCSVCSVVKLSPQGAKRGSTDAAAPLFEGG